MMSELFAERDPVRVARDLAALERFAARRDGFIAALNLDALDDETWRAITIVDERLAETILFGKIYGQHLGDMIALGASFGLSGQKAA